MRKHYSLCIYLLAALLCGITVACDEDITITTPTDYPTEGDIHFVLSAGGDSIGAGTPLAVAQGDTLSMTISQKSSYTDPDGTVFTCEPKATIELYATVDTIYAKDIETLLNINENAEVTTAHSGSNPVLYTINQKFMIGEQEVVFDLGHEVYSHVNSLSDVIEMPYVKVNEAKLGSGHVSEGGDGTRNSSPYVTLRALSLTRASITDSLMFEVSAKFNLELESVNTKSENKETLEFNVHYVGVVENVTELYGSVAYTINDKNGEVKSPFVVNGADTLLLEIKEESTYALADTAVYSFEPKATISLKVKNDTAFVEKYELLSALIETEEPKTSREGENPTSNLYEQVFATSSQEFLFETMYEVYTAQSGDEMPYLMIGEPKCIGIEVTEQKKDATTRAFVYDTVYYDVKAKFAVELNGVNVSDELVNTLEFEVNYVGGVINATEVVELVNITYRKNQVFYAGHDNLLPASQCEVYRDRHYSDGHVETDEFYDAPWMWVESVVSMGMNDKAIYPSDTIISFSDNLTVVYGDFQKYWDKEMGTATEGTCRYVRASTQVPDFEHVVVDSIIVIKHNEDYNSSYSAQLKDYNFNPDDPTDGWYVFKDVDFCEKKLKYVKDSENVCFRYYCLSMSYYDRFLCIDDTIIGFKEFRPKLEKTEGFIDYAGSETRGPGKIYQHIIKGDYLGHPVYFEITDTIYTPKK